MQTNGRHSNRHILWRYLGFAAQVSLVLVFMVWLGLWVDRRLLAGRHFFVICLPVATILAVLVKAVRDTGSK